MMRLMTQPTWCVVMLGLVACGGSTGVVTGDPLAEMAPPVDSSNSTTTIVSMAGITFTPHDPVEVVSDVELTAAFDELMNARMECGRRPRACSVDDVAAVGSRMHDDLSSLMESRTRAGIVASTRGSLRYRIDDVHLEGDVASVTTCLYDDIVLTMDGSIFDESTMSAITEWRLLRTANGWRWSDWRIIDSTSEGDLCGFAG